MRAPKLSVALCAAVALVPPALGAPLLPDKPIISKPEFGTDCRTLGYLEGPENCWLLEKLGEPVYPVTDAETRLAIRMMWAIGDRGTTITLRFEILGPDRAFLKAYENTNAGFLVAEGYVRLDSREISDLLSIEQTSDIWSQPLKNAFSDITKHANGTEVVTICYNGLTLSEMRGSEQRVVERECPPPDDKAANFARALIFVARHHFPDIGAGDMWRGVLK